MITLSYFEHFEEELKPLLPENWQQDLQAALDKANAKLRELGHVGDEQEVIEVNLMNNTQIQEVNKNLRGFGKPTDVISLRLTEEGAERFPGEVFGEIYISIEKCQQQAKEIGQSFIEELAFLLVHGILHIFGYDHMTPEEEAEMMGIAYQILGRE